MAYVYGGTSEELIWLEFRLGCYVRKLVDSWPARGYGWGCKA